MRVGVYGSEMKQDAGGGYSFQKEICEGLKLSTSDRHTFVVMSNEDLVSEFGQNTSLDSTNKENNQQQLYLNQMVRKLDLDMVWFLAPTAFQMVEVPFVYTVWDLQHRLQPYFPEVGIAGRRWEDREATYRFVLPRAAIIVTGTHEGKREIMQFYGIAEQNIRVVPFPVLSFPDGDVTSVGIRKQFDITSDYLFYTAQFWPHKNHINVLHALRLVMDSFNIEMEMVFTGSDKGNLSHVQQVAKDLLLGSYVKFPGFVSRQELWALYKSARALIFPSFFGPDNLPPLEAFSAGCPVLASRVPGSGEQLGDAALLFDPSNVKDIAESIYKIQTDSALRQVLVQRGLGRSRNNHAEDYLNSIYAMLDEFEPIKLC